jgi:hypothetical protein
LPHFAELVLLPRLPAYPALARAPGQRKSRDSKMPSRPLHRASPVAIVFPDRPGPAGGTPFNAPTGWGETDVVHGAGESPIAIAWPIVRRRHPRHAHLAQALFSKNGLHLLYTYFFVLLSMAR